MVTNNKNAMNTRKTALSGVLLAIVIITLFLATTSPVNEMSLYALSSFFVSVVIVELGIRAGWVFYLASCLLSLILPNKMALVPYILFFGIYGIIKYYIEKLNRLVLEYVFKLLYFNVFVFAVAFFARGLIPVNLEKYPWWILLAAVEVVFVVYDYAYTLFVQYYMSRIRSKLRV